VKRPNVRRVFPSHSGYHLASALMKMPFEALNVTSRVSYWAKSPTLALKALGLSPVVAM
jgi:hypothetical protein